MVLAFFLSARVFAGYQANYASIANHMATKFYKSTDRPITKYWTKAEPP